MKTTAKNVLGSELQACCLDPITGYFRDGSCHMASEDHGLHVVCAEMTAEFLDFTASQGNDLSSPAPHFGFPGLNPGDKWCLCVLRWKEALSAGCAPLVDLQATHIYALEFVDLQDLKAYAIA